LVFFGSVYLNVLMRVLFVNHWPILLYMNSTLGTSSNTHTSPIAQQTIYSILFSIAFAHLLNDLLQAVILLPIPF
jgi:hypothetical protein